MSDFSTVVAGQEVLDSHINQFAGWFNGDDPDWYSVGSLRANDDTNYLLTLRNLGSGGKALRILNSSGAEILRVDNSGITGSFLDNGGAYNVKDYGAAGDGVADDTVDIQDAINASDAANPTGPQTNAPVLIPSGIYLTNSLNATGAGSIGLTIEGNGPWSTFIRPNTNSVDVLDISGKKDSRFRGFQLGRNDVTFTPNTGILSIQLSGATVDAQTFDDIYVSGTYAAAAGWFYGVASSRMFKARWYNYSSAASTAALMFTHDNAGGVGAQTSAYGTAATGSQGVTDWGLFGSEVHTYNTPAATGAALWLDGVGQWSMYSGNISTYDAATPAPYVRITDSTAASLGDNITFDGVTMYSEAGPPNAAHAISIDGGTLDNLVLRNVNVTSDTSVIRLNASTTLNRLNIQNLTQKSTGPSLIAMNSGNGTLNDPLIMANGLAINLGASGAINGGILIRPGTITAATNTAFMINSAGVVRMGSGIFEMGSTPATVGSIRLSNNTGIYERNNGDSADVRLLEMNSSQSITIGQTSGTDVVQINSTTGVSLSYGATNRIATTSTGVTVTGHTSTQHVIGNGTTLVAGDFALGAGFGTTGAVSSVRGTDMACTFTVTPGGTGISNIAATVTLTFKNAFSVKPNALCLINAGTGATNTIVFISDATFSTTSVVLQPLMTPVSGTPYTFTFYAFQ